ncbi:MAG TPA: hypothetical protein VFN18_09765 [Solirubrobacterales bacterium]|nr:hypothetical protein [Solirubrobacterales bacterium]
MKYESGIGHVRPLLAPVSRLIFGKQYRLEVAAAASALDDPIWSRRLAQLLGLAENQVAGELGRLVEIGALTEFPEAHDRRKLYQLASHPIWPFVRDLAEKTIRDAVGEGAIEDFWTEICGGAPRAIVGGER